MPSSRGFLIRVILKPIFKCKKLFEIDEQVEDKPGLQIPGDFGTDSKESDFN